MAHLVLADDSPAVQKVIELSFADEEVEIHCFTEGKAALEYVNAQSTDVLLIDVSLPGLDGYQLCQAVKQNPKTARVPVVLLVGVFERFDEEQAQQVGCDLQLTKPLGTSQLVDLVKSLLKSSSSPPPSPAQEPLHRNELALSVDSPVTRHTEDRVFSLTPSQCKASPPSYTREFSRQIGSKPAVEGAALPASEFSLNEDEIDSLVSGLLEGLHQELRRLLPEVARDVLKRHRV